MVKYNRKDFYVVRLNFNDDVNKLDYHESIIDIIRFINIYKKNNYFALTLKKGGYYIDLVNHQIFGENTPFCVQEKKSLAELLLGPGKTTKLEALLDMISCVPSFAMELNIDYENQRQDNKICCNTKNNWLMKYPSEGLKPKFAVDKTPDSYHMIYDSYGFKLKKLNKILTKRQLKSTSTKHSINDFYFAVVKEKKSEDDSYISSNDFREYITLLLRYPDGNFFDLLSDRIITQNNDYVDNVIVYQEPITNYSLVTGNVTKANALAEARIYTDIFWNKYKEVLSLGDDNFSRTRNNR